MEYTSQLRPHEQVITDANADICDGDGLGYARGYVARDWSVSGVAQPWDLPLIPRSEWRGMIEQREKDKALLSLIVRDAGVKSKDQGQTNYCWCNAVITAIESMRAARGQKYVPLSPASVAAPVKRFQNVGGWGSEALAYIVEHGVVPTSMWPANAIDRRYQTDAAMREAAAFKVSEWWDICTYSDRPRDRFDKLMTALLLGFPVPIGLLWWSHEVCAIDPVALSGGKFGVRIRNSWLNWGDEGFAVLEESKAIPDDAVAPRSVTAN